MRSFIAPFSATFVKAKSDYDVIFNHHFKRFMRQTFINIVVI